MDIKKRHIDEILKGSGQILSNNTKSLLLAIVEDISAPSIAMLKRRLCESLYNGSWQANEHSQNKAINRMVYRANEEFAKYHIPLRIHKDSTKRLGDKRLIWINWTDDRSRQTAFSGDIDRAVLWWIDQLENNTSNSHNPDHPESDFAVTTLRTMIGKSVPSLGASQYVGFGLALRRFIVEKLSSRETVLLQTDHFRPIGALLRVAKEVGLEDIFWSEHAQMEIGADGTTITYPYYGAKMEKI